MRLIYAYIKQFRNIIEQEIYFSNRFKVTYNSNSKFPDSLQLTKKELNPGYSVIQKNSQLSKVHIVLGKTGAGKTNIFQMIGMPQETRIDSSESGDSYFLLYEADDFFVMESYSIPIKKGLIPQRVPDSVKRQLEKELMRLPPDVIEHIRREDSMQMYKFKVDSAGNPVDIKEVINSKDLANDITYIFNGYERYAFPHCPYEERRFETVVNDSKWQIRINAEYHKTTLWNSCRFLKEYIDTFAPDNIKRKSALVINSSNWAGTIKQHINEKLVRHDYWTFYGRRLQNDEARALGRPIKERNLPAIRHRFVHDLWTDFALYLRKWISYIEMFPQEIPEESLDYTGTKDVYQEYMDYLFEKERDEAERTSGKRKGIAIDPTVLPDYEEISILKRLEWLSMYIDRKDGYAKGLLWQIYGDIKDIGNILGKFDDKYFTDTIFSLPIEDMYTDRNKKLVSELFERMEQYRPDDTGIFVKELLPYHFTCISSGEYQYAKVLGGIEEYCVKLSTDGGNPHLIYLLDEPETYMHPELCRMLLYRLDKVLMERAVTADIQILISTHSPLLLSDVLPEQVTRLDLDSRGYCLIRNGTDKAYFGANIHTILADGFFLDYTIGEYARVFLQAKLDVLKKIVESGETDNKQLSEIKMIIPLIGDALIKRRFEMLVQQAEAKHD